MPNYVYSLAEKIQMVLQREQGLSYRNITDHFAATYPSRPIPSSTTIRNVIKKFRETGNLNGKMVKVIQPSRRVKESVKLDICLKVVEDPSKPVSQIAKEIGVANSTARKVLQQTKMGPYERRKGGRKKKEPPHKSDNEEEMEVTMKPELLSLKVEPLFVDESEPYSTTYMEMLGVKVEQFPSLDEIDPLSVAKSELCDVKSEPSSPESW